MVVPMLTWRGLFSRGTNASCGVSTVAVEWHGFAPLPPLQGRDAGDYEGLDGQSCWEASAMPAGIDMYMYATASHRPGRGGGNSAENRGSNFIQKHSLNRAGSRSSTGASVG